MAIQDDKTILSKADLKAYHEKILPYLGGNMMMSTNNSDYYSTDEKIIGVWTDGKPVYQKTFTGTTVGNFNTGITNGSNAFIVSGYMVEDRSDEPALPLNFYYDNTVHSLCDIKADASYIWMITTGINIRRFVITIQYTKTTDSAGSATTTPGAYDINFPNTWPANTEIYFSNGLYGYRAKGNFTATAAGATFVLNLVANAANFTIVNTGGSVKVTNTGGSTVMRMFGVNWSLTDNKPTTVTLIDKGTNNYLRFQAMFVIDKATASNTYDVWVTYTK